MIKSNATGSLKIQTNSSKIDLLAIENTSYRQLEQIGMKAALVKKDLLLIVRKKWRKTVKKLLNNL